MRRFDDSVYCEFCHNYNYPNDDDYMYNDSRYGDDELTCARCGARIEFEYDVQVEYIVSYRVTDTTPPEPETDEDESLWGA